MAISTAKPLKPAGVLSRLTVWCCMLVCSIATAADEHGAMNAEIDFLVAAVADMADSGCVFIRNGKEHSATEAVDHLEMKRKRGKRYYDTTEEFIDRIASKSSWSGKDYGIRCGSAKAVTAREWFYDRLADYRDEASG